MHEIHNGDCAEVMASMGDNSVDAIITDPPYGLAFMGVAWDTYKSEAGKRKGGSRTSATFDQVGGNHHPTCAADQARTRKSENEKFQASMTPIFAEALRVAKPGAHLLCFGGTRTFHRMACAIEDAGWEIRDCIMWVYGSGFPKSMDVAKAIDKAGGIDPKKSGSALMAARGRAGMSRSEVADAIGCTEASLRDWEEGRARKKGAPVEHVTPSPMYRDKLVALLGFTEDERRVLGVLQDRREDGSVLGLGHSGKRYDGAQTKLALEWDGWGTCLKPAWEPIIVARKPLDGTVASNVLKWGTGALNIDACRVPIEQGDDVFAKNPHTHSRGKDSGIYGRYNEQQGNWSGDKGRFPANVLHDGSQMVLELFPDTQRADGHRIRRNASHGNVYGGYTGKQPNGTMHSDLDGSAARFFYCAKASKKDRGEGNVHPTVKPTALMEWLVTLVTPQGGVVLDPFAGSGTTLVACERLGFDSIGIEREPEYVEIIKRRLGE